MELVTSIPGKTAFHLTREPSTSCTYAPDALIYSLLIDEPAMYLLGIGLAEGVLGMILPKDRDPRYVPIRRGGILTDADHQLLALWAALCAEHVLDLFESARPLDPRPRRAIECRWQRDQLPEAPCELVLDDQRLRNDLCWSVFDC
jgi:hypothetical protein